MVPVARSAPVTATTAPNGVLVCETVRAVYVYKKCPHFPLTLPKRMDSAADSASVGLSTSRTSAIQCLSATWTGSHFPG